MILLWWCPRYGNEIWIIIALTPLNRTLFLPTQGTYLRLPLWRGRHHRIGVLPTFRTHMQCAVEMRDELEPWLAGFSEEGADSRQVERRAWTTRLSGWGRGGLIWLAAHWGEQLWLAARSGTEKDRETVEFGKREYEIWSMRVSSKPTEQVKSYRSWVEMPCHDI